MTTSDIDAVFDLAANADNTPENADTPDNTDSTPQSNAEGSSADNGGALYPKVLRTLTASEAGDANPEGTLTISEFAAHLTVEAIKGGAGVEGVVDKANIYTATRATRHPLPVVLVFPDDADQSDLKLAKVYLPVAEATEAYENRPTRGEGANAATSKRSQEDLLDQAAKKAITLAKIQERLDRAQEQKKKAAAQLEKSYSWLAQFYTGTPLAEFTDGDGATRIETQEEANKRALSAAIAERAAKIEEEEALKADEAKKSDIPDSTPAA